MSVAFEFDDAKARQNVRKHGVSFAEAMTVFDDPHSLFKRDEEHSDEEDRWHVLGASGPGRVLLVAIVERSKNTVRIISARKATTREVIDYAAS